MSKINYFIGCSELLTFFVVISLPPASESFINPTGVLAGILGSNEQDGSMGGLNNFLSYLSTLHDTLEPGLNNDEYLEFLKDQAMQIDDKRQSRRHWNQFLRIGRSTNSPGNVAKTNSAEPWLVNKRGRFMRIGRLPLSAFLRKALRGGMSGSNRRGSRVSKSTMIRIG